MLYVMNNKNPGITTSLKFLLTINFLIVSRDFRTDSK
jgi:hypothetical protein